MSIVTAPPPSPRKGRILYESGDQVVSVFCYLCPVSQSFRLNGRRAAVMVFEAGWTPRRVQVDGIRSEAYRWVCNNPHHK